MLNAEAGDLHPVTSDLCACSFQKHCCAAPAMRQTRHLSTDPQRIGLHPDDTVLYLVTMLRHRSQQARKQSAHWCYQQEKQSRSDQMLVVTKNRRYLKTGND